MRHDKRRQDHQISALSADDIAVLKRAAGSKGLFRELVPERTANRLVSSGALVQNGELLTLSRDGRQALRRAKLQKDHEQVFVAQHQDQIAIKPEGSDKTEKTLINRSECPLSSLASRKKADGSPYLSKAMIEAGERLRRDFEKGNLRPSMGINWDRLGEAAGSPSKKARRSGQEDNLTDNSMAARHPLLHALDYVGEELSGALLDFCCYLIGLEEIERKRRWPARSAKQILALALQRLARHYGLENIAKGPTQNGLRHWGTEDYRPKI